MTSPLTATAGSSSATAALRAAGAVSSPQRHGDPGRPGADPAAPARSDDSVSISTAGQRLAERHAMEGAHEETHADAHEDSREQSARSATAALSEEDRREVAQLRARDREVRAHEQAHAAAGGGLAGSPKYDYQTGPDGVQYAVGGSVAIELREGGTPSETRQIAQQVRRAALAPANPSAQDRSVAAQAAQMEARALAEERTQALEEGETTPSTETGAQAESTTQSGLTELVREATDAQDSGDETRDPARSGDDRASVRRAIEAYDSFSDRAERDGRDADAAREARDIRDDGSFELIA